MGKLPYLYQKLSELMKQKKQNLIKNSEKVDNLIVLTSRDFRLSREDMRKVLKEQDGILWKRENKQKIRFI